MVGLVRYNFEDPELSVLPDLATDWHSSKDLRTWTFKIREGVVWTDGVPFTPQQVIDGIERLLNPKTAAEYAYMLYDVQNAKAYNQGKIKDFSKVGVRLDGQNLVVTLDHPKSFFPSLLTMAPTYPIRKDIIAKYGDLWTEAKNIQTLGPFRLKEWKHDSLVIMERNDTFYGTKAKIKNLMFFMVDEFSTAINLFDAKALDAVENLPSNEIKSFSQRPEFRQEPILKTLFFQFNTQKVPTNNVKVRQALVHAIDRRQIARVMANGVHPLLGWIPEGMFGYEPDVGLAFDVPLAKKLLAEAGYSDRSKFPRIAIAFNNHEDYKKIAENIQAQLKKNLGIEIEIQNQEWKTFLRYMRVDPAPLARFGWQADFPDPDNFFNLLTSDSENNTTKWKNPEYDRLVEKAAMLADRAERKALYLKAQRILMEDQAVILPICSSVWQSLIAKRVRNFPKNSIAFLRFDNVELVP
jgi:oligopeptide transport system substrate-binding protein